MRMPFVKAVATVVVAVAIALVAPAAAFAKPPGPAAAPVSGTTLGNDISWPQCGSSLPKGQAFGVVGVNGGLANDSNRCFSTQLAWAQGSTGGTGQPKAALYVNTANPGLLGSWWPSSNTTKQGTAVSNPYGTCAHGDDAACAYVYGYAMAQDDATVRGVVNPAAYLWWLDVETENTWSSNNLGANAAALEGMTAYLKGIGARVGIYSTNFQWGIIAGQVSATSNLNGLPSWLAGASSEKDARARCLSGTPLTPGGTVAMVQFVSKNLDYNVSCF
jgi:hypothetical protein